MSGAFSVPFAGLAAFSSSQYGSLIWGAMAYAALVFSAFLFWRRVVALETKLKPAIVACYDPSIQSCDAIVSFSDGTKSRCFRIKVDNIGTSRLYRCEGWLESIREFPLLSPARLFWIDKPGGGAAVDLTKGIPRFLQVFRIHESNVIIPATYGNPPEQWPIDLQNKFVPGKYLFRIGFKGDDGAETVFCSLELNWTGDWNKAEVTCV